MNLHEYQAKILLMQYGLPIPEFWVASTLQEVSQCPLDKAALKIQVHAGGRGKAGGVKFASSKQEIKALAERLIGMKMVNEQTGPEGIVAQKILLTRPISIAKEYYLGALIDRDMASPLLIASMAGGVEIEEVARKEPEKILKIPFSFEGKLRPFQMLRLCKFMGWEKSLAEQGKKVAAAIARAFIETDASLLEINPLVLTPEKGLYALDAKLSVDENALFRQPKIASFYDPTQGSPQEAAAKEFDLAYIAMPGNIGCMVNGAGLAMATMDIIQLHGGMPANFLDVGGGASKEKVAEGFKIILSDPKVEAILVNIFGGIMNCQTIAEGIIHAVQEQHISLPLVVRMEGTNVEGGKRLLQESHLKIETAANLDEAAKRVVQAAKRGKR